jgi:hypothetical protein
VSRQEAESPGSEAAMLLVDEMGQPGGVPGIILATGGLKGLAEAFEGHRVDGKELEVLELGEEGQEVAAGLLDADGNGRTEPKLTPDGFDPDEEILGTSWYGLEFDLAGTSLQQADVNFGIGAINPDAELIGRTVHGFVGVEVKTHAGPKTASAL